MPSYNGIISRANGDTFFSPQSSPSLPSYLLLLYSLALLLPFFPSPSTLSSQQFSSNQHSAFKTKKIACYFSGSVRQKDTHEQPGKWKIKFKEKLPKLPR